MNENTETCANCGEPIADLTYGWSHISPGRLGFYCGGRGYDASATEAIPATEATHECPVHHKVTGYHACPALDNGQFRYRDRVRHADGRTGEALVSGFVGRRVSVAWDEDVIAATGRAWDLVPQDGLTLTGKAA